MASFVNELVEYVDLSKQSLLGKSCQLALREKSVPPSVVNQSIGSCLTLGFFVAALQCLRPPLPSILSFGSEFSSSLRDAMNTNRRVKHRRPSR